MRNLILSVLLACSVNVFLPNISFARGGGHSYHSSYKSAPGSVKVRGYYTKRGTYVAPYHRTKANSTKLDNYSTKGNINPYTGKAGTKSP